MKGRTPFYVIQHALSYILTMHDFSCPATTGIRYKFWNEECGMHPAKSTCKTFDV